jgi:hypothetical protein
LKIDKNCSLIPSAIRSVISIKPTRGTKMTDTDLFLQIIQLITFTKKIKRNSIFVNFYMKKFRSVKLEKINRNYWLILVLVSINKL